MLFCPQVLAVSLVQKHAVPFADAADAFIVGTAAQSQQFGASGLLHVPDPDFFVRPHEVVALCLVIEDEEVEPQRDRSHPKVEEDCDEHYATGEVDAQVRDHHRLAFLEDCRYNLELFLVKLGGFSNVAHFDFSLLETGHFYRHFKVIFLLDQGLLAAVLAYDFVF